MDERWTRIYHGAARQLPMRWQNNPGDKPQRLSLYEILPGEVCTLHVHTGKAETWVIAAGSGIAMVGNETFNVSRGDALATSPGSPHRLVNSGAEPLIFLNLVTLTGGPVTTTELEE